MKERLYAAGPDDTAEEAVRRVDSAQEAARRAATLRQRERRQVERERAAEEAEETTGAGWPGPMSLEELAGTGVGRFSGADIANVMKTVRAWMRKHVGTDDRQDRGLSNADERRRDRMEDEAEDAEEADDELELYEDEEEERPAKLQAHKSGWTKKADFAEDVVDLADDTPEEFGTYMAALKKMCMVVDSYKSLYGPMRIQTKSSMRLLKVFDFQYVRENTWATRRTLHCPSCGRAAVVQEAIMEPGKWLVICPHCMTRSISTDGPLHAVKAWNDGKYTDDSELLMYVGREHAKRAAEKKGGAAK